MFALRIYKRLTGDCRKSPRKSVYPPKADLRIIMQRYDERKYYWAFSSAVERFIDIEKARGSTPLTPAIAIFKIMVYYLEV